MSFYELEERIVKWNKERNGLKFDVELEKRLLDEEIKETHEAFAEGDPAHILQELSDIFFVIVGTEAKLSAALDAGEVDLDEVKASFGNRDTITTALLDMCPEDLKDYLKPAATIVVTANEAKGTAKDADGKVVKGEDYVSPLEQIQEMLKECGYGSC